MLRWLMSKGKKKERKREMKGEEEGFPMSLVFFIFLHPLFFPFFFF